MSHNFTQDHVTALRRVFVVSAGTGLAGCALGIATIFNQDDGEFADVHSAVEPSVDYYMETDPSLNAEELRTLLTEQATQVESGMISAVILACAIQAGVTELAYRAYNKVNNLVNGPRL